MWDSGGSLIKNLLYNNIFNDFAWHHVVVTFDGGAGGDPAVVYVDGLLTAADSGADNTGTLTDNSRLINYGCVSGGTFPWEGNLGHFGIWNVVLDQNDVDTLFIGEHSINLTLASGTYDKQANLQHYYRPGFGIGRVDQGVGTGVEIVPSGLDASNIVVDAP
jgi:hypothetical protein